MNHIKYLWDKSELEEWDFTSLKETFLLPGEAFNENLTKDIIFTAIAAY